jgi:HEAT repeat protein
VAIRLQAIADWTRIEKDLGELVPLLATCLDDSDPEVRARAAFELGLLRMMASDAVPQLKALALNDSVDRVRSHARDALYNIRLYDFGPIMLEVGTPVP